MYTTHQGLIISHVSHDGMRIQDNEDHLKGVAMLAKIFASEFNMGDWGEVLGLLHDIGKQRNSFQNYIMKKSGINPQAKWHGEDKRHAYVGALLAKELYKGTYPFICYPIMGHHCGLDNYNVFIEKMKEPYPKDVDRIAVGTNLALPNQIIKAIQENPKRPGMYFQNIIRMLYSCLVDADYLDTESFMDIQSYNSRQNKESIVDLLPKLEQYLKMLKDNARKSEINDIRQKIQDKCRECAVGASGFYSLTVPTGGGKTLSSILWAIIHCIKQSKKRIIIAIPYTSIVTQTAQLLSNIFGKENVLEHHSNVNPEEITSPELKLKLKLATENWNYPIIVTTNVQLFSSMFSNKPSKCRKLHNIANSVVIIDEPQTLPICQLQPLIDSLVCYKELFNTSFLFTTASLPVLNGEITSTSATLYGIRNIKEIIPPKWELYNKLKRVDIIDIDTIQTHNTISSELQRYNKVLCIVNTRKDARAIFEGLPNEGLTLHLSRMMCSAHLKKNIDIIKNALSNNSDDTIRVVATQLLEAGVDIDFPVVFRQEAGLDSVLQAAGRCNREGKHNSCITYVFRFAESVPSSIRRSCYAYQSLPEGIDKFSPEAMQKYFMQLYSRITTFDKYSIGDLLYEPQTVKFEDAAQRFSLIDADGSLTVYVNYEDSDRLIEQLKNNGPSYQLLKSLSNYSVTIHKKDFDELLAGGLIEVIHNTFYYIRDRKQYDDKVGLITENHWLDEILMI